MEDKKLNISDELKASFEAILQEAFGSRIGVPPTISVDDIYSIMLKAYNLDKWVDVKTPPEIEGERVLCITTSGLRAVGYILHGVLEMDGRGKSFYEMGYDVAFWQLLPAAPLPSHTITKGEEG